jgi:hypothetical protein
MHIEVLLNKTMVSVVNNDNQEIIFTTTDGEKYKLYHQQVCCESVTVDDITGDLGDLVGAPILKSEETSNRQGANYEFVTWTFYHFATIKGYVTIRWCGSSNGYYSEAVDFEKVN